MDAWPKFQAIYFCSAIFASSICRSTTFSAIALSCHRGPFEDGRAMFPILGIEGGIRQKCNNRVELWAHAESPNASEANPTKNVV
jgi:hypothetical protein